MKTEKQIRFSKGNLGDAIGGGVRRSARAQKTSRKKQTEIHFSIVIENRNWDMKLVFLFDNENKKWKKKKKRKSKFYFLLKQKLNVLFDSQIYNPAKVTDFN